jgi:hypothetical protein
MVVALVAVGLLTWAGVTLLWDAWLRRDKRPDLTKRLRPLGFDSVADEARFWPDERDRGTPRRSWSLQQGPDLKGI